MQKESCIGVVFGKLKITDCLGQRGGHFMVRAICECGNEKDYRYGHLKSGATKSCGCLQKKYKRINVGDVFGRLVVIDVPVVYTIKSLITVKCECGVVKDVIACSLNLSTKSCGCLIKDTMSNTMATHRLSKHPLYRLWARVKSRCYDVNSKAYEKYGAKGVGMCSEWRNDFMSFFNWAIKKDWDGKELDKDILYNKRYGTRTGKIYSPDFCMFVTPKQNCRAKSTNRILRYNGVSKPMVEWGEEYNIKASTIGSRIRCGWPVHLAITTPVRRRVVVNK